MKFSPTGLLACVCLVAGSGSSSAQTERDLDSHEHGASKVNVVIDGSSLFVEFESPWMNLVGFEHSPSTAAQRTQLDNAMAMLRQPERLYTVNAEAACHVKSILVKDSHEEGHEEGHEERHEEGHEKGHEEGHEEHKDESTHSEVTAEYVFACESSDDLTSMTLSLIEQWPGIVDIDVQLAGPSSQTAFELNADFSVIDFSVVK